MNSEKIQFALLEGIGKIKINQEANNELIDFQGI